MWQFRTLLVGSIGFGLMPMIASPVLASETWNQVSYMQVLEGPEKIWVFVEVERITSFDEEIFAHFMSAHPRKEVVSRSVFAIDSRGKPTEQVVSSKTGPTFHSNLSRIFRLSDGFYLYGFPAQIIPLPFINGVRITSDG